MATEWAVNQRSIPTAPFSSAIPVAEEKAVDGYDPLQRGSNMRHFKPAVMFFVVFALACKDQGQNKGCIKDQETASTDKQPVSPVHAGSLGGPENRHGTAVMLAWLGAPRAVPAGVLATPKRTSQPPKVWASQWR